MLRLISLCQRISISKSVGLGAEPLHQPTIDQWPVGHGLFPKKQISISGWNVNGYRSIMKKGELQKFMDINKPDFLCLNETKIDFKKYQELEPEIKHPFKDYYGYWNFCKIKAGYSGVAIFAKEKPINIIEDFQQSQQDSLEGRVICLQYQQFYVLSVYKPNSGMKLERLQYRTKIYDTIFKRYLKSLMENKPILVFGDMNVAFYQLDIYNCKKKQKLPGFTRQQRQSFQQLFKENKLVDTFRHLHPLKRQYTWWSYFGEARKNNLGWRLDYILTDPRLKINKAIIHDQQFGSDHCPVSAILQL